MATEIDVMQFGAVADGAADNTEAFRQALTEAGKAGNATVRVPEGTFRFRLSDVGKFTGLRVPEGCQLVGAGAEKTILFGDGTTANPSWKAIRFVLVESNTRVADLTIDGNKDAIPRDRFKDKSAILLRTMKGSSNIVFENLHVRGQFSDGEAEGFGISVGQATDVTIRNIEVYDNDGSGVSVDAASMYEQRSENVTIDNVRGYRNGWQAVTTYGATNITITNVDAHDNIRHGLNCEWSNDVVFRNCVSRNNGYRGLRVAGQSNRVRWENILSENNGANAVGKEGAELLIGTQTYGVKNPATGEFETGYPQDVEVINCTLKPPPGIPHVLFGLNVEKISVGSPSPQRIVFDGPGVENWTYQSGEQPNRQVSGVQFPSLARAATTTINPAQAGNAARAEVGGAPVATGRDTAPRQRQTERAGGKRGRREQEREEPGLLERLADAVGLDLDLTPDAPEERRAGQRRRQPAAKEKSATGRQRVPDAPDARATTAAAPPASTAPPGESTVISVAGKGGYVDYPLPGSGRIVCRLHYRIANPSEWRFQLREDGDQGKDFVQEVRHRIKAEKDETDVWFDSELLTPPNVDGPQVLRVMCTSEGENSLELAPIELAQLS